MAAPVGGPIPWPDHPLAASGGEILATRILPLIGHNARDFACAAAVCPGWRAAATAAAATLNVYRETDLVLPDGADDGMVHSWAWSPCGKYIAAASYRPYRVFLFRASTGALANAWDAAPGADEAALGVLQGCTQCVSFSRDGSQLLTQADSSGVFAVWSVPEGRLLAATPIDAIAHMYTGADLGVPGSASDGLVGLGLMSRPKTVHLWDVSPPPVGDANLPRLKNQVVLGTVDPEGPVGGEYVSSFAFSPIGDRFAAVCDGFAYVYDVASLTRLGVYAMPWRRAELAWAPGGQHVLLSCTNTSRSASSACLWNVSRTGAPPVVTVNVGFREEFQGWLPSGASYLVSRQLPVRRVPDGPKTFAVEERRVADGRVVRAVSLQSGGDPEICPTVCVSPDSSACLVRPSWAVPSCIVVFD